MIWIIDDDDIFKFSFTFQLQQCVSSDRILLFADITSAIESLRTTHEIPSLIFLDINFPDLDGWDFLNEFIAHFDNSNHKKPTIYMVSSSISIEDQKNLENYEFVKALLIKPITNEVIEAIDFQGLGVH